MISRMIVRASAKPKVSYQVGDVIYHISITAQVEDDSHVVSYVHLRIIYIYKFTDIHIIV